MLKSKAMSHKRILIISAHPEYKGLGDELVKTYLEAARAAGHKVELLELNQLDFDPILHHGYKQTQKLEPDLQRAQTAISQADHLVFVYPVWWENMPALLKGFVDRVFLPDFAFRYTKTIPEQLLKGKSGRIIVTMDGPELYDRLITRRISTRVLERAVLKFCGVSPVRITRITSTRRLNQQKILSLIESIKKLATKGE
jgi:NAD(P)H dehydrogenase (quinone)